MPSRDREEANCSPLQCGVGGCRGRRAGGAQPTRPDTNPSVFRRHTAPLSHLSLFQLGWKNEDLEANSQEMNVQPVVSPWARGSPVLPAPHPGTPGPDTPAHPVPPQTLFAAGSPQTSHIPVGPRLGVLPHPDLANTECCKVLLLHPHRGTGGVPKALGSPLHTMPPTHGHTVASEARERRHRPHPFC